MALNPRALALVDSLGRDRSVEVCREVFRELGVDEALVRDDDARKALARLVARGGLVGAAARVVQNASVTSTPEPEAISRKSLCNMLAPALGDETSRQAVERYASQLGMVSPSLTIDQADRLLESMAQVGGILGTVAVGGDPSRFTKVRLALRQR